MTKDFENALKEVLNEKPDFKCTHGPLTSVKSSKSIAHDGNNKIDFEKILRDLKAK